MPTVKFKCPDTGKTKTKTFPYNAVGKAQAETFSKLMTKYFWETCGFPSI